MAKTQKTAQASGVTPVIIETKGSDEPLDGKLKPGYKETPDDMREILYRMVSNVCGCSLHKFSALDESDNEASYEEMAELVATYDFLHVPTNEDCDPYIKQLKCFDTLINNFTDAEIEVEKFRCELQEFVACRILAENIEEDAVGCIKTIYKVAKMAATSIRHNDLLETHCDKVNRCRALVDGIYLGLERFELGKRRSLKQYVNIWKMDTTCNGGTDDLPGRQEESPVNAHLVKTGADLVRHVIEKATGQLFMAPLLSEDEFAKEFMNRRAIDRLCDQYPKTNRIIASGKLVTEMVKCYQRYIASLDNSAKDKENKLHKFQNELDRLLFRETLSKHDSGFASLAAFYIALYDFVKSIYRGSPVRVDRDVFVHIVKAAEECLSNFMNYISCRYREFAWSKIEESGKGW